jgi:hypothetical protein
MIPSYLSPCGVLLCNACYCIVKIAVCKENGDLHRHCLELGQLYVWIPSYSLYCMAV